MKLNICRSSFAVAIALAIAAVLIALLPAVPAGNGGLASRDAFVATAFPVSQASFAQPAAPRR